MNNGLDAFKKWAKGSPEKNHGSVVSTAVAYTRVSSKEQAEKTLSLSFQAKVIKSYSERTKIEITEWFGGTFESAKTDGRKEFQRLLDYIKKHKGRIKYLLVYTTDRFSRTGPDAMKLADQLRKNYGVYIIAVTQPVDTTNPHGIFQQNLQLLFSEYDNQLRKQRAVAGMKEKMERGIWCIRPPFGYSIIRDDKSKRIVINEKGHFLRKAFEWKARGIKNQVIIKRLGHHGINLYKQKLSAILKNPFYAGIISTKLLDGKLVEGTHEKLISSDLFLKVNNIKASFSGYGVSHKKEVDTLPLKVFLKCSACGSGYTGFQVKAKDIWYYKCRSQNCRGTVNSDRLNKHFAEFLSYISIKKEYINPLSDFIKGAAAIHEKDASSEIIALNKQLDHVQQKISTLEEKYYVTGLVSEELFNKFNPKYQLERSELATALNNLYPSTGITAIDEINSRISNLASFWRSLPVAAKEKLQSLIFPNGLSHDKSTNTFHHSSLNPVFTIQAPVLKTLAA